MRRIRALIPIEERPEKGLRKEPAAPETGTTAE